MTTVSLLRPRQHPVGHHPARTRERILAAALREFSDKGFAGARVDRIARRARINKRMLYHYFGNKAHLFREILARKVRERSAWAVTAPDDAAESLAFWFDAACRDRDWVRLMEWEALGSAEGVVSGDAERLQLVHLLLADGVWLAAVLLGASALATDAPRLAVPGPPRLTPVMRTFLRGVGATVALPFLDAMAPALATSWSNVSVVVLPR